MKKFLVALFVFVMMFGCINVFSAEQVEPEYNTSISGDIALNLNDDWQPGLTIDTQGDNMEYLDVSNIKMYFQVYADIHITGNTDAERLSIQSAGFPTSTQDIEIDSNGNFDQEVKLILTSFDSIESNTINFGAYVSAHKGDKTVKVKIGKGELKTNFLMDATEDFDLNNDGIINSLDFALFRKLYLDYLQEEYSKMDKQESLNTYIYNEWYMKDFVMGKDGFSFNSQTHLKAKTDATKITLHIENNGENEDHEYLTEITGEIDEIKEVSGVIPIIKSSDIAASTCVKAFKGNREIELRSNLRERKSGDAVIGDLNYDKSANSIDFAILRKYLMGMIDRFPVQSGFYCADVNDDKKINSIDFAYLRMYLLGAISNFPKSATTIISPVTPTPTPVTSTPTPTTPTLGYDIVTIYNIDNININDYTSVEIFVEKSPMTKIIISASDVNRGRNVAIGWEKTYFRLSGSAVNGVDYEKIDFNYFWRKVGNPYDMELGDNNPKDEFFIIPIDTNSNETKDLEIYFGDSDKCAATIHFVKGLSDLKDENKAKQLPETVSYDETYYKPDSITKASCYSYEEAKFYTQNVIIAKTENSTKFPTYYEPKEIFYIEENEPTSLKVIKNPPICDFPVSISNTIKGLKPETTYYYGTETYNLRANSFKTMRDYNKPLPTTPTPDSPVTPTPTSSPSTGMVTYYKVDNIDVNEYPGAEIFVEKSPMSKIWISAETICRGPLYADGWAKTYFELSGSAVNGVDYEKIDFDHFWREIGTGFSMELEDDNPRGGFYITPIDTGTDETKDLEIYFGGSTKPAATIHFVKSICDLQDKDRAKQIETRSDYVNYYLGGTTTFATGVSCNSGRFYSKNFIAEKVGNPTSYLTYYQPQNIYYMEKDVPSSLKVVKNPPVCNFPLSIINIVNDLKPSTTYVYGNELYSLNKNTYLSSQNSFTTTSEAFERGELITHYKVNGAEVSPGSCQEFTVEKSPENKIWISANTVCVGNVHADGWSKTEFKLSGSAINGEDYEKIDFDYFWRIVGSDLYMSPGDSNPQKGFYITPIDTDSDETKDLEIYLGSTDKPAAIIHLVEENK